MSDWTPIHHESTDDPADQEQVSPARAEKQTKAALKADEPKDREPAIVMTFPPHMIAGIWSLSEALEKNTEATRELIEELRAARKE